MAHLTLRIRSATQAMIFQSDFTLHEFIPLVRQVIRTLEVRPYLADRLKNAKAIITPRYDATPRGEEFIRPDPALDLLSQSPGRTETTLQISEEDVYASPDTAGMYKEEIAAYSSLGNSPLCLNCPDRDFCPVVGRTMMANIDDRIRMASTQVQTNEPVRYFTLQLESQGERLYERDFMIGVLQPFVNQVWQQLKETGTLPASRSTRNLAEIIARYEGQPIIDPALGQAGPISYLARGGTEVADHFYPSSASDIPETLVNWEEVEAESEDLDITLLPTEQGTLPRREKPASDQCEPIGQLGVDDVAIFVRRTTFEALRAATQETTHEVGGILVGNAFLPLSGERPYVEIAGIIPATNKTGDKTNLSLDYALWRQVDEQLSSQFPGQRIVGWYRTHIAEGTRLALYTGDYLIEISPELGDRLNLSQEESFMHQNFFKEAWHVGLVIDPFEDKYRFYQWRGQMITECPGYFQVNKEHDAQKA